MKKWCRRLYLDFEKPLSNRSSILLRNLILLTLRRTHRFFWDNTVELFYVQEGNRKQYFAERGRGFSLYWRGLKFRGNQLFHSYGLQHILFLPNDVVFDCGANYGDLWINLSQKITPENYFTFEPGPNEFKCLKLNSPLGSHFNLGLGEVNGEASFYLSSEGGDSTFIEPVVYTEQMTSLVVTLDSFVQVHQLKGLKLLKLEAEGFEPEIIRGSELVLHKFEYIAIDGGPERGIQRENTFTYLTNFLMHRNFEIIFINNLQNRALFKSRSLVDESILKNLN